MTMLACTHSSLGIAANDPTEMYCSRCTGEGIAWSTTLLLVPNSLTEHLLFGLK